MSRNPEIPFTYEYSQPSEYRFSLDSIEMPWEIAKHFQERMAEDRLLKKKSPSDYLPSRMRRWKTLDLCAGCGVLGLELNFHLPEIQDIVFVEVQSEYMNHFETNLKLVKNALSARFLNVNYEDLLDPEKHPETYDLILCNPPYFKLEQGKQSPSEFKNRCRFFIDSTFEKLIEVIEAKLSPTGEAYLLLRTLEEHGFDLLSDLRAWTRAQLDVENLTMIRGTFLLKLSRKN